MALVVVAFLVAMAASVALVSTIDDSTTYDVSDFDDHVRMNIRIVDGQETMVPESVPGMSSVLDIVNDDESDEPVTIRLTKDLHLSNGETIEIDEGERVIIEGDGHTIYREPGNVRHLAIVYGSLEIRNATVDGNGALAVQNGILVSGGSLILDNCHFVNCESKGQTGGAVRADEAALTIVNCTFTNNKSSKDGGAVYGDDSTVSITGSTFDGNSSKKNGGAVSLRGCVANFESTVFKNNRSDGNGGAVIVGENTWLASTPSTVRAVSCEYDGNAGKNGGAVRIDSGLYTMDGGTMTGNTASMNGGAVSVGCNTSYLESAGFVMNVGRIAENVSQTTTEMGGGAIHAFNSEGPWYNSRVTVDINGGTIDGNTSARAGGAISMSCATLTIGGEAPVAIHGNTARTGGAVYTIECDVTVSATTFRSNACTAGNGGAINLLNSTFTLDEGSASASVFESNRAKAGSDSATLTYGNGGALSIINSTATIYGGLFTENVASNDNPSENDSGPGVNRGNGGAVFIDNGSTLTVYGGTFQKNNANNGGAIRVERGSVVEFAKGSDVSVTGNTANRNGGGIAISGGHLILLSGSITDNSALGIIALTKDTGTGGGLHVFNDRSGSTVVVIHGTAISGNKSNAEREIPGAICPDTTQMSVKGTVPAVFIGPSTVVGAVCLFDKASVNITSEYPGNLTVANALDSSIVFSNQTPVKLYGDIIGSAKVSASGEGLEIVGSVTLHGEDVNGLDYIFTNVSGISSVSRGEMDVEIVVSYTPVPYDLYVHVTAEDADGSSRIPEDATVVFANGSPATFEDSLYTLSAVPMGTAGTLSVDLPGYEEYSEEYVFSDRNDRNIYVTVHENIVHGTVLLLGQPRSGATVTVSAEGFVAETLSAADGTYSFARVPSGPVQLTATYSGAVAATASVVVSVRDTVADLVLRMDISEVAAASLGPGPHVYTSEAITPAVTVSLTRTLHGFDRDLVEGVDYTVSYGENIHVSDGGMATVTGIGLFAGKINLPFDIEPFEIAVSWGPTDLVYSGYSQVPTANGQGIGNDGIVEMNVSCTTDNKDAGTYDAVAVPDNSDYAATAATSSVQYRILPYTATVVWGPTDLVYEKGYQVPTALAFGVETDSGREILDLTIVCDNAPDGPMHVGDYTATASISVPLTAHGTAGADAAKASNYTLAGATTAYSVSPRTLTAAWSDTTLQYTGAPLYPSYTLEDVCDGDRVEAAIASDGDSVEPGTYTATLSLVDSADYALDPSTASVAYTISSTLLDGTVTVAGGSPAEGATVTAFYGGAKVSATTDSEGHYSILTVPAGADVTLTAEAPGMYSVPVYLHDFPGHSTEDIGLLLNSVSGKVLGPDGKPMAGIEVWLTDGSDRQSGTSSANGSFKFYGPVAGGISITTDTYGYVSAPYTADYGGGELSGLTIQMSYRMFEVHGLTDEHSSAYPDTQSVRYLGNASIAFLADDGYHFVSYAVDDGSDMLISGKEFAYMGIIYSDTRVSVVTEMDYVPPVVIIETFTILGTASDGGSVTGSGVYEKNEMVTLTAVPEKGFQFYGWSNGSDTVSLTFPAVEDLEVVAFFKVESSTGGDVDDDGLFWVPYAVLGSVFAVLIFIGFWNRRRNEE